MVVICGEGACRNAVSPPLGCAAAPKPSTSVCPSSDIDLGGGAPKSMSDDGQRGLTGRLRSKTKRGGLRADLIYEATASPVGAGLPAMVAHDDVGYLTLCGDLSAAIAGKPAPTGKQLRTLLLLWLLILGAPLNHDGRRQVLRSGPTEQCLNAGMPSLGEAPSGGARALWLLWAGPALRLFQSDPL